MSTLLTPCKGVPHRQYKVGTLAVGGWVITLGTEGGDWAGP